MDWTFATKEFSLWPFEVIEFKVRYMLLCNLDDIKQIDKTLPCLKDPENGTQVA